MLNLGWMTDVHLNHLRSDKLANDFIQSIASMNLDGIIVTGDIAESTNVNKYLSMMAEAFRGRMYFVLGNHDFWGSSVTNVRSSVSKHASKLGVSYLTDCTSISVTRETAIVGHDGWYDGRNGSKSRFRMNDWMSVAEYHPAVIGAKRFSDIDMSVVCNISSRLANDAVEKLKTSIESAVTNHQNVIVCTHVPPWEKAHYHEGRLGDANALPWFVSKVMGDMLESMADANPHVNFTVLCGHTHGKCELNVRDNMTCYVGGAEYGGPTLQSVIGVK